MRFVVFKGVQGFGDRLQCLLQVIRYARATGRYLVLDWRDTDWTHDPKLTTDVYFTLKDVKTFGLKEFLAYYAAYKPSLKVVPGSWKHCLTEPNYFDWIYKPMFWLGADNEWIDLIATYQRRDFDAEVVVYSGVGKRSFTYSDASAMVPSRWVQGALSEQFKTLKLTPGSYGVIHLRGGSKAWQGGKVPLEDLRASIEARWPTRDSYLDALYKGYQEAQALGGQVTRVLLLSDSHSLAQEWIQRFGVGETLATANQTFSESGTHKLSVEDLRSLGQGLSKEQLNLELLRDFVFMLHAQFVVNDGVSLFSEMAKKCSASGVRLMDFSAGSGA